MTSQTMASPTMELRTFKAPRADIHLIEGGSGPDLFFLHGAGGITADNPFLAALAEKYHVYAPLLPGYGESEEFENTRLLQDFTPPDPELIIALVPDKPHVLVNTMGGMIPPAMPPVSPSVATQLS